MYKLIWKIFGKGLLSYYLKDQNKPKTHSDLTYAFTDQEGKKYYRYPDQMNLPLERFNKLQEFHVWMSARLTPEQLDLLVDKGISIISKGIEQGNNAAKVTAILYQIKEREAMIVPHQLVLNMIAVQLVREDETPQAFDNDIQLEKVKAFMADAELHDTFFLTLPELRRLLNTYNISKGDWMKYSEESQKQEEVIKKSLEMYS